MPGIVVAADQLKSIVQRVERLESEIADLNADKSDIYKEARSNGFDVKAIKKVISKRKLDSNEREEQDMIFDTYWDAVHGSGLVHAHAREKITQFDPINGEFVDEAGTPSVGALHAADTSLTARETPEAAVVGERPPAFVHTHSPETANEVPAQDGRGTGLGESLSGKSKAARPASVDAQPNGRGSAGEAEESVVTVVGTESGTVAHSDPSVKGGNHVADHRTSPSEGRGLVSISATPKAEVAA